MLNNALKYSIRDECLYGSVNGVSFSMRAYSGGGRGSTKGVERTDIGHWSTAKKAPANFDESDRGGPIPVGLYLATHYGEHQTLGQCAELTQTIVSLLQRDYASATGLRVTDRDGFFIHGRGPKGSDGCIVPSKAADLMSLLAAIAAVGGPVILIVHSEGMSGERLDVSKKLANVS